MKVWCSFSLLPLCNDISQFLLFILSGERRVTVVRSPKSGVNFFSLGDFEEQLEMASARAQPAIVQVSRAHATLSPMSQQAPQALPAQ